jgi:hypothetical protein
MLAERLHCRQSTATHREGECRSNWLASGRTSIESRYDVFRPVIRALRCGRVINPVRRSELGLLRSIKAGQRCESEPPVRRTRRRRWEGISGEANILYDAAERRPHRALAAALNHCDASPWDRTAGWPANRPRTPVSSDRPTGKEEAARRDGSLPSGPVDPAACAPFLPTRQHSPFSSAGPNGLDTAEQTRLRTAPLSSQARAGSPADRPQIPLFY